MVWDEPVDPRGTSPHEGSGRLATAARPDFKKQTCFLPPRPACKQLVESWLSALTVLLLLPACLFSLKAAAAAGCLLSTSAWHFTLVV